MSGNKEMSVVRGLDLERYMGRWYEIACFPSRFQPKDGENTRATYTLDPDNAGTVRVLNETFTGGKRGFIEGTAYKADPTSDEAKLKVKFYVPPFLPIFPVVGDYWVLFVDPDYQYALVGQPSRRSLWILSRKPLMEEEVYNELVERAMEEGYDVSKLRKTPQSETPPEGDAVDKDTKGIWWIKSLFGKWATVHPNASMPFSALQHISCFVYHFQYRVTIVLFYASTVCTAGVGCFNIYMSRT